MTSPSSTLSIGGRLPGVRCEPALPATVVDRIRLDVAAFVGFAERGPAHTPVALDDVNQYQAVFGGDLGLALDERGVPVYAALPSAVRSFFDNGGRRCVVVRVVGQDAEARPLPVSVTVDPAAGLGPVVHALVSAAPVDVGHSVTGPPFELEAASEGGWADRAVVEARIVDEVLPGDRAASPVEPLRLTAAGTRMVESGDLLHLVTSDTGGWLVWVARPGPPLSATSVVRYHASPNSDPALTEADPLARWPHDAVVRRLRLTLTVHRVGEAGPVVVERREGLRFSAALADQRATAPWWGDVVQAPGPGFDRERSMFVRGAVGVERLVPLLRPVAPDPDDPPPGPVRVEPPPPFTAAALARDDLVSFSPSLFVDRRLVRSRGTGEPFGHPTVEGVRSILSDLELEKGSRLHGLHAVAPVDEVGMIAVPDLYHRRWFETAVPGAEPPDRDEPPSVPIPIGFVGCRPAVEAPIEPEPPVAEPAEAVRRLVTEPVEDFDLASMVSVEAALTILCAARADVIGVLGLPLHASVDDAHDVVSQLTALPEVAGTPALSHVGLWHPWPRVLEERSPRSAVLRAIPPDGSVCGVAAARELEAGAWAAPAGRILAGVVARAGALDRAGEVLLFDASVNVVRQQPRGFTTSGAHSLSPDRSLLQLSVRRLLILLRKLALREGTRYVFAVDNDRFRQQVAAAFVRVLGDLQGRGAISAFEVVVAPVASAVGPEEGRLRIDLKVAPTSPIEYLTVNLVRNAEGLLSIGGS